MAQKVKRLAKAQLWIGAESVLDTFETPPTDGSGIFMAENVVFTPAGDNYEPQYVRADGLKARESGGLQSSSLSFEILLKGSGTTGQPPDYAEALKAVGFQEVVTPGTRVDYAPVLDFDGLGGNPAGSYSAVLIEDGIGYPVKGSFGTWTFAGQTGQPGRLSINLQGGWQKVADLALRTGANKPSYDPTKALPFQGANFQYLVEGGATYPGAGERVGLQNFNVDGGNVMSQIEDAAEKYGIPGFRIVDRKLTGSFDPEMRLPSERDFFDDWENRKPFGLQTGPIGNTAGNRWQIDIRRADPRALQPGDRNGVRILEYPFGVSSFNDDEEGVANQAEFTLSFT